MSPRFISGQHLTLRPVDALSLSLHSVYTSRAQLDNTGNATLTLPASFIANASAEWRAGRHSFALHVNNLTNRDAFGGGHVAGGEARYFVVQPVNFFALARLIL
jgi:hypothetical protein